MFVLGLNEFIRNIKRNLFVIVQMILIYMISIFVVSAFEEQYSLYGGMSGFLDDTGVMLYPQTIKQPPENDLKYEIPTRDDLMDNLKCIKNIETTSIRYELYTYEDSGEDGKTDINIIASNPELVKYRPPISEGKWCDEEPHKEGVINVVVSNNVPFSLELGQIFELNGFKYYIAGFFDSSELVYGSTTNCIHSLQEMNYLDFYQSVDYINERNAMSGNLPMTLFIASYDDMMQNVGEYDRGRQRIFIDFNDDITEKEYNENMNIIKNRYGYEEQLDVFNTKLIYDNSWKYLDVKFLPMGILLIVVVLILIVSMLTSSAINVLYEKKNYGIYFICGNDWKKTFGISAVHWVTVAGSSLIVAVSGCMLMKASGKFEQLTLSFTNLHVIVISCVTVITLFVAMVVPYSMLRKIQPVSILKENDR